MSFRMPSRLDRIVQSRSETWTDLHENHRDNATGSSFVYHSALDVTGQSEARTGTTPTAASQSDVTMTAAPPNVLEEIAQQLKKLDKLETIELSLASLCTDMTIIKQKVESLETGQRDLETATMNNQEDIGELQREARTMGSHLDNFDLYALQCKVELLENQCRKQNIIILNVPERLDRENASCKASAGHLLAELMNVDGTTLVAAHRIGQPRADGRDRPLLVLCRSTEDRNNILQSAPRKLKGKTYHDKKIIITDDVCEETRVKRKRLVPQMMKLRQEHKVAFIPFDRPPCIRYRDGQGWKTLLEKDL